MMASLGVDHCGTGGVSGDPAHIGERQKRALRLGRVG
jgi:hypothetical protein